MSFAPLAGVNVRTGQLRVTEHRAADRDHAGPAHLCTKRGAADARSPASSPPPTIHARAARRRDRPHGEPAMTRSSSMRKLVLSGIVLASGMAGTAQAASTLASGPVFGGQQQQQVACEVVNLGSTPITFLTKQLVGQFKSPLTLNFNDCGAALRPGATCSFQANVNDPGDSSQPSGFLQSCHSRS